MLIDLSQPIHVSGIGKGMVGDAWNVRQVREKDNLILYMERGTFTLSIDGKIYKAQAGDIIVIPKGVPYMHISGEDAYFTTLYFDACCVSDRNESPTVILRKGANWPQTYIYSIHQYNPILHINCLIHCQQNSSVKNIMQQLGTLNLMRYNVDILLLNTLFRELLIAISTEKETRQTISLHLKRMLKYIEQNYTEDITSSTLAEMFGISQTHVSRLFRKELQTTSSDYVNRVRISAACELLHNTQLSIGEIAEQVGYDNQYYFNRMFKKYNYITPGEYRHMQTIL